MDKYADPTDEFRILRIMSNRLSTILASRLILSSSWLNSFLFVKILFAFSAHIPLWWYTNWVRRAFGCCFTSYPPADVSGIRLLRNTCYAWYDHGNAVVLFAIANILNVFRQHSRFLASLLNTWVLVNGNWKSGSSPEGSPGNNITRMKDINITWFSDTVRNLNWDTGLKLGSEIWSFQVFHSAYKTVYDDDTSVLNSIVVALAMLSWTRSRTRSGEHWRPYWSDSSTLCDRSNGLVNDRVKGIFDNRYVSIPAATISDLDNLRGFSWSMPTRSEPITCGLWWRLGLNLIVKQILSPTTMPRREVNSHGSLKCYITGSQAFGEQLTQIATIPLMVVKAVGANDLTQWLNNQALCQQNKSLRLSWKHQVSSTWCLIPIMGRDPTCILLNTRSNIEGLTRVSNMNSKNILLWCWWSSTWSCHARRTPSAPVVVWWQGWSSVQTSSVAGVSTVWWIRITKYALASNLDNTPSEPWTADQYTQRFSLLNPMLPTTACEGLVVYKHDAT